LLRGSKDSEANAKLIAAAPEMLNNLGHDLHKAKEQLKICSGPRTEKMGWLGTIRRLEKIIKKATE